MPVRIPFSRPAYEDRSNLSDLILRQGEIRANALRQQGAISGQMWANVGNIAGDALTKIGEYKAAEPERKLRESQLAAAKRDLDDNQQISEALKLSIDPETGRLDRTVAAREVAHIDPLKAQAFWDAADSETKAKVLADREKTSLLAQQAGALRLSIEQVAPPLRSKAYTEARASLIEQGVVTPEQMPERYDSQWLAQTHLSLLSVSDQLDEFNRLEQPTKTREVKTRNADGSETIAIVEDTPGQTFSSAAPRAAADTFLAQLERVAAARKTTALKLPASVVDAELRKWEAAKRAPKDPSSEPLVPVPGPDGKAIYAPRSAAIGKAIPDPPKSAMETRDARKFKQAGPILRSVEELSEKINTQQGLLAKMSGGASKIAAQANYDDDVAEYHALIMGFTPLVARALGHTGVLTEQDVVSVRALFPAPGDSKTLRDRKVARINTIISELESDAGGAGGGAGLTIEVEAPDGNTYTFPDQAAADAFKKAAGIK